MAKRSPILGYNHNVRYRGIVFHVQTEDSGIINPHVFSHLFYGGIILSSRKLVYDPDSTEDVVKSLMQAQHKAVLKDLRRGLFDDKIDSYLAGTPGLWPRGTGGGDAVVVDAVAAEAPLTGDVPPVAAEAVELPVVAPTLEAASPMAAEPMIEAPALAVEPPAPAVAAELPAPPMAAEAVSSFDTSLAADSSADFPAVITAPPLEPAPSTGDYPAVIAAPSLSHLVPPPLAPDATTPPYGIAVTGPPASDPAAPAVAIAREPSAPAIEVIEALEPLSEADFLPDDVPSFELQEPGRQSMPVLDLDDDSPFGSITARTPPPLGLIDETERVPVLPYPESIEARTVTPVMPSIAAPVDPEPLLHEPLLPPPQRLDLFGADDALLPPPLPDLLPSAAPLVPEPSRVDTSRFEPRVDPAAPTRIEPARTGQLSAVRVSFVSARGGSPTIEPPLESHAPAPAQRPTYDVVPLDAIETPPGGITSFDDLLPPPLPPPPPSMTARSAGPGATPPFGVPRASTAPRIAHETVPRLAGVPAPTPPLPMASAPPMPMPMPMPMASSSPPMVAVPAPPPPPHHHTGRVSDTLQRVPLHTPTTPAIDDDDLLAAGLVESADVAEIHAPPLPSATAPPGVAPERPGEYHVTRNRPEATLTSRPPSAARTAVTPPRPVPGQPRPPTSPGNTTFRGTQPATPTPATARPAMARPATRPPVPAAPATRAETARAETARAETARPEPAAPVPPPPPAAPPRPPPAARPTPRPRPTTGAGVVVSRPAVIVGAPPRPTSTPSAPARPRRARDTGADGMITERSLDEVILAYLSEDASEE